jgi:hypothetical protein
MKSNLKKHKLKFFLIKMDQNFENKEHKER